MTSFGEMAFAIELAFLDRDFLNSLEKQDLLMAFSEEAYTFIRALFLFHPY